MLANWPNFEVEHADVNGVDDAVAPRPIVRPYEQSSLGRDLVDAIAFGTFSHDLLIHDTDEELVAGTAAFVEQGLHSGGNVLVHSNEDRVAMLRSALGVSPHLQYALDSDLYRTPMTTLFNYERTMAEASDRGELWVTGTVPFGADRARHPAWTRYESLLNEVLRPYPFHALCTYDTRVLPAATVAAAAATHPCVRTGADRVRNIGYVEPGEFLTDARGRAPSAPTARPTASTTLHDVHDLSTARHLLAATGRGATALAHETLDDFVVAVNEVLVNGVRHGRPPVELTIWAEPSRLTCQVTDAGPGIANPLAGYSRHLDVDAPKGLWMARQLCDELVIGTGADANTVLMTTT